MQLSDVHSHDSPPKSIAAGFITFHLLYTLAATSILCAKRNGERKQLLQSRACWNEWNNVSKCTSFFALVFWISQQPNTTKRQNRLLFLAPARRHLGRSGGWASSFVFLFCNVTLVWPLLSRRNGSLSSSPPLGWPWLGPPSPCTYVHECQGELLPVELSCRASYGSPS